MVGHMKEQYGKLYLSCKQWKTTATTPSRWPWRQRKQLPCRYMQDSWNWFSKKKNLLIINDALTHWPANLIIMIMFQGSVEQSEGQICSLQHRSYRRGQCHRKAWSSWVILVLYHWCTKRSTPSRRKHNLSQTSKERKSFSRSNVWLPSTRRASSRVIYHIFTWFWIIFPQLNRSIL